MFEKIDNHLKKCDYRSFRGFITDFLTSYGQELQNNMARRNLLMGMLLAMGTDKVLSLKIDLSKLNMAPRTIRTIEIVEEIGNGGKCFAKCPSLFH